MTERTAYGKLLCDFWHAFGELAYEVAPRVCELYDGADEPAVELKKDVWGEPGDYVFGMLRHHHYGDRPGYESETAGERTLFEKLLALDTQLIELE